MNMSVILLDYRYNNFCLLWSHYYAFSCDCRLHGAALFFFVILGNGFCKNWWYRCLCFLISGWIRIWLSLVSILALLTKSGISVNSRTGKGFLLLRADTSSCFALGSCDVGRDIGICDFWQSCLLGEDSSSLNISCGCPCRVIFSRTKTTFILCCWFAGPSHD